MRVPPAEKERAFYPNCPVPFNPNSSFFPMAGKIEPKKFQALEKYGTLFPMSGNAQQTILHIDMDAFFAAVEVHDNPELKGKPLVIGSPRDKRGVVSTCSYEARKFGIHSGMPSRTAAQRCPKAIFLPVRMSRYHDVSKQIMEIFERFTPHVQPLSCDEAFLDVTGSLHLFGDGPETARKIKAVILEETGLTCSVGIAPNLFLAKIASDMNKTRRPDPRPIFRKTNPRLSGTAAHQTHVGRRW